MVNSKPIFSYDFQYIYIYIIRTPSAGAPLKWFNTVRRLSVRYYLPGAYIFSPFGPTWFIYFTHSVPLGKGRAMTLNQVFRATVKVYGIITEICLKNPCLNFINHLIPYIFPQYNLAHTSPTDHICSKGVQRPWTKFLDKGLWY